MIAQITARGESHRTLAAQIRLVAGVLSHVNFQAVLRSTTIRTFRARKLVSVHVALPVIVDGALRFVRFAADLVVVQNREELH